MSSMQIIATQNIEQDGELIASGTVLGSVDSVYTPDQLQSLLYARTLAIVCIPDFKKPEKIKLDDDQGNDANDPNAPETDDESNTGGQTVDPSTLTNKLPESSDQSNADDEQLKKLVADEFPGLNLRIALALYAGGIKSPEALREKVNSGYDIEDLDNIGRKAKKDALAWLDTVLPPPKTDPETPAA